jgi:RPA family protein
MQKRQTAVKVSIGNLLSGSYVKQDGMLPNYVLLSDNSKASRVNLMGVVVSIGEDTGFQSVFIDDGTGKMSVRAFEDMPALKELNIGDCVSIIGRPREFGTQIYVLPEIIKTVTNPKWIEVRKAELAMNKLSETSAPTQETSVKPSTDDPNTVIEEEFVESSVNNDVINKIKELDTGNGADFDEVIKQTSAESEKIILSLMKNGDVFEVSPGKLKVLE